jgi:hypothetical protein
VVSFIPILQVIGWAPKSVSTLQGREMCLAAAGNTNPDVGPIGRRYTDRAIPVTKSLEKRRLGWPRGKGGDESEPNEWTRSSKI